VRAVRIHEDGGPEVLVLEEAPDPLPGPGEVLVRLRASALNHLDVWIRKGLPSVPKPRILGADGAGVVEALGEDVTGFELGERVVLNPGIEAGGGRIHVIGEHGDGTNAELIAVPATNVHPIPDGLSFEEAAAFPLVFETAYRMLVTRAGLREGEWVLVWGIGGGVSTAALAIAKALGARVLVSARTIPQGHASPAVAADGGSAEWSSALALLWDSAAVDRWGSQARQRHAATFFDHQRAGGDSGADHRQQRQRHREC